jgi:hypothetical protein
MLTDENNRIVVGWLSEDGGETIVYDPQMQLPDSPYKFCFTLRQFTMLLLAQEVWATIKFKTEPKPRAAYSDWKSKFGTAFLDAERRLIQYRNEQHARGLRLVRKEIGWVFFLSEHGVNHKLNPDYFFGLTENEQLVRIAELNTCILASKEPKAAEYFHDILTSPSFKNLSTTVRNQLRWACEEQLPIDLWTKLSETEQIKIVSRTVQESRAAYYFSAIFAEPYFSRLSNEIATTLVWVCGQKFPHNLWTKLDVNEKFIQIFRTAKYSKQNSIFSERHDDNPLVDAALKVLFPSNNPIENDELFSSCHSCIEDWIIQDAWNSAQPIDVGLLLPRCDSDLGNNFYCEGLKWQRRDDHGLIVDDVYCPRKKAVCHVSHITPYTSRGSIAWSLLELLATSSITPKLPGLQVPERYVPQLCGWVNRLNEVRNRLKCSVCGELMRPNRAYAKMLAKFNVTVVSCANGEGHDTNIYLNQCWACDGIIDSRESRHRVEDYYICILCGSGPMKSNNYTQGDSCPKCGTNGAMSRVGDSRYWVCSVPSCQHKIWLPRNDRLTGPHNSERQHGYQKKSTA